MPEILLHNSENGYNVMNAEYLRLFVLAADKLNISAAGRDLGLAPAVASARLAKVEHSLGADLLHRSTRKVALSLEGLSSYPMPTRFLPRRMLARLHWDWANPR